MITDLTASIMLHPWLSVLVSVLIGALLMLSFLALIVSDEKAVWIVTDNNFAHILLLVVIATVIVSLGVILIKNWQLVKTINIPKILLILLSSGLGLLLGFGIVKSVRHLKKSR